jgi:hypothetical protein
MLLNCLWLYVEKLGVKLAGLKKRVYYCMESKIIIMSKTTYLLSIKKEVDGFYSAHCIDTSTGHYCRTKAGHLMLEVSTLQQVCRNFLEAWKLELTPPPQPETIHQETLIV